VIAYAALRDFCGSDKGNVIAHIRGAKKTAFASTAGLFESWYAIGNATEAYKLVRSFVVDLKKFALADSVVAQPVTVRQEPKRNVCDAPEPSASEPKRCKPDAAGTEVIIVEDDSDPEDCVIIERPKIPPPRCAGNRAPPLPPRHPYVASAWTAARRRQKTFQRAGMGLLATAGTRCALADALTPARADWYSIGVQASPALVSQAHFEMFSHPPSG
jgi:hypothetical protein